jgi:hypothetical protein
MWFLGYITETREVVEIPEVTAMTRFDDLSPTDTVWVSSARHPSPLPVPRGSLERME